MSKRKTTLKDKIDLRFQKVVLPPLEGDAYILVLPPGKTLLVATGIKGNAICAYPLGDGFQLISEGE